MNTAVVGLLTGMVLGFAGYFGGFGAFLVVAVVGAVGLVVGHVLAGGLHAPGFARMRDDHERRHSDRGRVR